MQIQANLGSTIAMAFDECVENPAQHDYSKASCERTVRWLARCQKELARLKHEGKATNPDQLLFGINQGCTYADLRVEHMKQIAEMNLDGYAIGGLAVGEPTEVMYEMISEVEPYMPVSYTHLDVYKRQRLCRVRALQTQECPPSLRSALVRPFP